MFDFILQQWVHGRMTEDTVRSYCPEFITEDELKEILGRKQLNQP